MSATITSATPKHLDDLRHSLPIRCATCTPRDAVWHIEFERVTHGLITEIHWHVCDECLPSCLHAARVQNQGITAPLVSELVAA